jgi:hypothetical protein
MSWAKIKRNQANDADQLAACASGIGEYGIANACYRLAGILRKQATEIEEHELILSAPTYVHSIVTDEPI